MSYTTLVLVIFIFNPKQKVNRIHKTYAKPNIKHKPTNIPPLNPACYPVPTQVKTKPPGQHPFNKTTKLNKPAPQIHFNPEELLLQEP